MKKVILTYFAILRMIFSKFLENSSNDTNTQNKLEIDTGSFKFPISDRMKTPAPGVRSSSFHVTFPKPFSRTPQIILSFRLMDVNAQFNTNFTLSAHHITPTAFDAKLTTWADCKINAMTATWLAHTTVKKPTKKSTIIDLGIAQMAATDEYNIDDEPHNEKMLTGQGEQSSILSVNFTKKFNVVPRIFLGLNGIDFDGVTNQRVSAMAYQITRKGFKVEFKKWGDTKLSKASVIWLAFAKEESSAPKSPEIDSGITSMPKSNTMRTGNNERHSHVLVKYINAFKSAPQVALGFTSIDLEKGSSCKISFSTERIGKKGFILDYKALNDTKVLGVGSFWIAVEKVDTTLQEQSLTDTRGDVSQVPRNVSATSPQTIPISTPPPLTVPISTPQIPPAKP